MRLLPAERNHEKPVPARRVQGYEDATQPGDWYLSRSREDRTPIVLRFMARCPCGCGAFMALPIERHEKPTPGWMWDGNEVEPTLQPSIRDVDACKWHGYLTKGVWTPCPDSGR